MRIDLAPPTRTFSIDQSTLSNPSLLKRGRALTAPPTPALIDIQDAEVKTKLNLKSKKLIINKEKQMFSEQRNERLDGWFSFQKFTSMRKIWNNFYFKKNKCTSKRSFTDPCRVHFFDHSL